MNYTRQQIIEACKAYKNENHDYIASISDYEANKNLNIRLEKFRQLRNEFKILPKRNTSKVSKTILINVLEPIEKNGKLYATKSQKHAADTLNINRSTIGKLMIKYDIETRKDLRIFIKKESKL